MSKSKGWAIDVMNLASEISEVLKRDPVMAGQVKEYFSNEQELLDLLALEGTVVVVASDEADEDEDAATLARCVRNVPLNKVLRAYREHGVYIRSPGAVGAS